jgi:hypothetical protein
MGRRGMHKSFLWRNLKEREQLEYLGVDGKLVLKWILKQEDGMA